MENTLLEIKLLEITLLENTFSENTRTHTHASTYTHAHAHTYTHAHTHTPSILMKELIDIKDDCCTEMFSGNGNSKVLLLEMLAHLKRQKLVHTENGPIVMVHC